MCVLLPLLKLSPASAGWHWGQRGKLIFCLLASCRYCLASHEIKACTVSCFNKIGQAVDPRVTGREKNKLGKERCASSINFLIASLKNKEPKATFLDSLDRKPGGLSCAANVVRCCLLLLLCCWFPKQRSMLPTFWFAHEARLFDLPVQNLSESTKCGYILEWILFCMCP